MSLTFSIITPVYNGSQYINKCIESVNKIEYDHNKIEHIIIDDGSTDDTRKICLKYAKKYKHIKFYSKSNGNWGSVINYVKKNKLVHNDYVVVCDADDIILPHAFKIINKKSNNYDMIIGSFSIWDGKRIKYRVHTYHFLFKRIIIKKYPLHYFNPIMWPHFTYMSKKIFYSTNSLREGVSYQDAFLYLEAYMNSKKVLYIRKIISIYWKYRQGSSVTSISNNEKNIKILIDNLKIYEKRQLITNFFYLLIGVPELRKYLIKNKIKFNFNKTNHPDFSGWPWWIRIFLRIMIIPIKRKLINWTNN